MTLFNVKIISSLILISLLKSQSSGGEYDGTCKNHEHPVDCESPCQPSCMEPDREQCPTFACTKGCHCNDEYLRDENNTCIPKEKCRCPPYEQWLQCGSACPLTCANYIDLPICTLQCVAGCFCIDGYVRDPKTNICINTEKCPERERCGEYEYFSENGKQCEASCEDPEPKYDLFEKGTSKCCCNYGYVRHRSGNCVKIENCDNVCQWNETYSTCGNECGHTCRDYASPQICPQVCYRGCFCKTGYVRDHITGMCVQPPDCLAPPECPLRQTFYPCGGCVGTCVNPHPVCDKMCHPSKCDCLPGMVRNCKNECVVPCECSM